MLGRGGAGAENAPLDSSLKSVLRTKPISLTIVRMSHFHLLRLVTIFGNNYRSPGTTAGAAGVQTGDSQPSAPGPIDGASFGGSVHDLWFFILSSCECVSCVTLDQSLPLSVLWSPCQ